MAEDRWNLAREQNQIVLAGQAKLPYSYLSNCAGLHADQVAHRFGLGMRYTILPFRGGYYQLKHGAPFRFKTNLYPVLYLKVPFLGVHASPSIDGTVYFGPTATTALGRENYSGLKGVEPMMVLGFLALYLDRS